MTDNHPRDAAIYAAVTKFTEIIGVWERADADETSAKALLSAAEETKKNLQEQYEKLIKMAELFGFDLDTEHAAYVARRNNVLTSDPNQAAPIAMAAASIAGGKARTVKDRAIEEAKQAYPNPIRASGLRQKLEAEGNKIHEKTVGMTLYRLLREGVLRRAGWDWFFVPEGERKPSQGKENPDVRASGQATIFD